MWLTAVWAISLRSSQCELWVCVSLGSADYYPSSACDMMRGGHKGLVPPHCWCGTLPVCKRIFADSSLITDQN